MTMSDWLAWAIGDAERRRLPELKPVFEALARTAATLRAATWNADASGQQSSHQ